MRPVRYPFHLRWLAAFVNAVVAAREAAQDARMDAQDKRMSALTDKEDRLEAITTQLGAAVKSEVADLKTAIASGTATPESLDRLDKVGDLLQGMVTQLTDDDVAAVAPTTPSDAPAEPAPAA